MKMTVAMLTRWPDILVAPEWTSLDEPDITAALTDARVMGHLSMRC